MQEYAGAFVSIGKYYRLLLKEQAYNSPANRAPPNVVHFDALSSEDRVRVCKRRVPFVQNNP